MVDFIVEHKEWLFSGVGVALLGWFFSSKGKAQNQKGGDNSVNIQVGGNFDLDTKSKDE